jgi:NAD(P)-dependent dehydrogenase (short-subunit alcohol dehydrogenase family)
LIAQPSLRLDGRMAIVTGASEGIGRAIAEAYAQAGARVVLIARRADALEVVRSSIIERGGEATALTADLSRVDDIVALAARFRAEVDDLALPLVLVNNAGNDLTKPALDVTEADWDRVHDLHLKGTFFCAQAIAAVMIARGYGKIINMSSTWSRSAGAGKSVYCAAKAGVSHLTAALSTEWAPLGVRVNALAPTAVMTSATRRALEAIPARAAELLKRIPLGRLSQTADLIGAALFLASDASDFVTGDTLFVDGGFVAAR